MQISADFSPLHRRLSAVVVVPVTPFDEAHQVDLPAFEQHIRWLAGRGLDVICINGNASEFYSLSLAEQARLTAALPSAAGGALTMTGIGYDVETAVAAGRAAQAAGVDAVMVHHPPHPFVTAEGWTAYHQAIAEGLPGMGVTAYIRSTAATPEAVRALAERCPNFVGVKYAVPDPLRLAAMIEAAPPARLAWVCGLAELWAPYFWAAGARGFTSGLANANPVLALRFCERLRAGDLAGAHGLLPLIRPFEAMRARHDSGLNVAVVKEAMAHLGLGSRRVRPPSRELSPAERAEVAAIVGLWSGG
jgi:4-hydroxy-tetrahydrodipicolinate synthase